MSIKWLLLGVFIFALFSSSSVNAQTPTTTTDTFTTTVTSKTRPVVVKNTLQQVKKETREEFVLKLNKIKDERKKALVDKINTKIADSNTKATDKMTAALTRLTEFLAKLTERSAAFKAAGRDTTGLDGLIATAQTAIAAATAAVDTQATKIYTLTITSDSTVKAEVGTIVSQFRLDIQSVHKTVVDAKQAVMNAMAEAARLTGKTGTSATGSGIIQ